MGQHTEVHFNIGTQFIIHSVNHPSHVHAGWIMKHFVIRNECAFIQKVSVVFQRHEIAFDGSGAGWVGLSKLNEIYWNVLKIKIWLLVTRNTQCTQPIVWEKGKPPHTSNPRHTE